MPGEAIELGDIGDSADDGDESKICVTKQNVFYVVVQCLCL
jgi:hypothetical protein